MKALSIFAAGLLGLLVIVAACSPPNYSNLRYFVSASFQGVYLDGGVRTINLNRQSNPVTVSDGSDGGWFAYAGGINSSTLNTSTDATGTLASDGGQLLTFSATYAYSTGGGGGDNVALQFANLALTQKTPTGSGQTLLFSYSGTDASHLQQAGSCTPSSCWGPPYTGGTNGGITTQDGYQLSVTLCQPLPGQTGC